MPLLNRRRLLQAGLAAAGLPMLSRAARAADIAVREISLVAGPAEAALRGDGASTPVWAYGGRVPGPEIRVPQGARLRVTLINRLERRPPSISMGCACRARSTASPG